MEGIEPSTLDVGNLCSNPLSYIPFCGVLLRWGDPRVQLLLGRGPHQSLKVGDPRPMTVLKVHFLKTCN